MSSPPEKLSRQAKPVWHYFWPLDTGNNHTETPPVNKHKHDTDWTGLFNAEVRAQLPTIIGHFGSEIQRFLPSVIW